MKMKIFRLYMLGFFYEVWLFKRSISIGWYHMVGINWKKEVFGVPKEFYITAAVVVGYCSGHLDELSENLQKLETAKCESMFYKQFAFKTRGATVKSRGEIMKNN